MTGKLHIAKSYILIAIVEERKQLNIRIPNRLYQQIENTGQQKQDIVTAALELYFSSHSNIDVAKDLEITEK